MKAALVMATPTTITPLGPRLSIMGPTKGAMRELRAEPMAMAPVNTVRLQPNSSDTGTTNTERRKLRVVASLNTAAKATATMTQP